MTALPIIKKMINQTEKLKETIPYDSKAYRELEHIKYILDDVSDRIIFNSQKPHSYNDNI